MYYCFQKSSEISNEHPSLGIRTPEPSFNLENPELGLNETPALDLRLHKDESEKVE